MGARYVELQVDHCGLLGGRGRLTVRGPHTTGIYPPGAMQAICKELKDGSRSRRLRLDLRARRRRSFERPARHGWNRERYGP